MFELNDLIVAISVLELYFCTSMEGNIVEQGELTARQVRQVYLITYSQSSLDDFPTRSSFAMAVLKSFSRCAGKVLSWCCCLEEHKESGYHYHMAIKFDRNQRWLRCKRALLTEHGISVHFSANHLNYYSAWHYVTKSDKDALHSVGHPDLENSLPRTYEACRSNVVRTGLVQKEKEIKGNRQDSDSHFESDDVQTEDIDRTTTTSQRKKRKSRLSAFEVSEIIVGKGIKTRTELLALAYEQKMEGKTDLAEFVVNRGHKVVDEVLTTAWEMKNAKYFITRAKKSRIEILREAKDGECIEKCHGEWLCCAKETLKQNGINVNFFQDSVLDLLNKGRGKYRNIFIVGPANCGKTFILNPLTVIFKAFCNPACTSFAWVGAEDAECLFLNDFRWSPAIIQWHDLLLLLEGQLVHLPAPKSHFARDIVFAGDTPIFATGKHSLVFIKNGVIDERETEMMCVRWKIFHFYHQIPQEAQKDIPSCPRCFAKLILGKFR